MEISASINNPEGDQRFAEVEGIFVWRMRFPIGVIANCSTGYSYAANRFAVHGSKASLTLEPASVYYEHKLRVASKDRIELI